MSLDLVLFVVAAVCFSIAAFFHARVDARFDLVAAGLFFFTLTFIV